MKYIPIILLLFLTACSSESETVTVTPPPIPVIIPPPPPPESSNPVKVLTIYNGTGYGTSDGTSYFHSSSVQTKPGGKCEIIQGDILYTINEYGEVISTERLPCNAEFATVIDGVTWSFEVITPDQAYSMGALARYYTRIWTGETEYGNWYLNEWQIVRAYGTLSGDIIAIDTANRQHGINTNVVIGSSEPNGLLIHSFNITPNRANIADDIGDYLVYFNLNSFLSSVPWQTDGTYWYNWNGYRWNATDGLQENFTALNVFIQSGSNTPVVVSAGSRIEHADTVFYWVECNEGKLYRYTPRLDLLETVATLWNGSGLRTDGVPISLEIEIVSKNDYLFFEVESVVYRYEFSSGMVSVFASGVEIRGM